MESLTNGIQYAIAQSYAVSGAILDIMNASPAVATLATGHGITVGSLIELTTPGWQGLDVRVVRVSAVAGDNVTLEGVDTTDTNLYPPGSAAGSQRKITAWANIAQVIESSRSGGAQEFYEWQYQNEFRKRKVPTVQGSIDFTLVTHNDEALPHVAIIKAAKATGAQRGIRITLKNGNKWYGSGYWSIEAIPEFPTNAMVKRTITLAFSSDVSSYAS